MQNNLEVAETSTGCYRLEGLITSEAGKNNEVDGATYRYSEEIEEASRPLSWIISLLLGLQAVTVLLVPLIWFPRCFMSFLCLLPDDPVRIEIVSLMVMVTGISTLVFNTFDRKLHVLFSPSIQYYESISHNLSMQKACPGSGDLFAMGYTKRSLEWKSRMNTVQSGLILTNLLTALAGLTGLCRWVDSVLSNKLISIPATVALGLSQAEDLFALNANNKLTLQEDSKDSNVITIVIMTVTFIIIVAFKFGEVKFRLPCYSLKKGFFTEEYKLFQLFPILISTFCVTAAYSGVYALVYGSKPDESGHAIPEQDDGSYFILHKPFQFGWPKLEYELIISLLPHVFINIATSVVIFRATRFACGENKLLTRTVTNGVLSESLLNLLLAGFGLSSNVSAFNIGLGRLTGVFNQRILQLCGLILIIIAIHPPTLMALSRINVFHLQTICFLISMLVSVTGLSMIQGMKHVSNRDFTVIGSSIFASIFIPKIVLSLRSDSSLIIAVLLEILSSSIMVAICSAILMDKLLRDEKTADEENDEQRKNNYLSFSEELFSLCF